MSKQKIFIDFDGVIFDTEQRVVERKNLKHNLKIVREIISKDEKQPKIIAVIKGNGYGLGLVEYAQFLIDNGYVTQKIDQLRKNILPKKDKINDFEIIRGWRDSPYH